MNYNQFLQTPISFAVEVAEMLDVKKKWGLALTREEKMLKKHLIKYYNEKEIGMYRTLDELAQGLPKVPENAL